MLGLVATGNDLSTDMQDLGDVRGTQDGLLLCPSPAGAVVKGAMALASFRLHEKFSSGFAALLAGCGSCFLRPEPQSPRCVDQCPDFS